VVPCDDCKGEGEVIDSKAICKECKGKKVYEENADIEVTLEPGVPHEHDYVLTGESDEAPNILAGDLHVRIMIKKHKTFSRKGADLFIEKKITLLEALTGFNFEINHLDGKKILVATAPNEIISHHDIKVIKGKGMPFWKDSMGHGHLYIKFEVEFPAKGTLKNE
jgi:DnaJ family protein A protein 2